MAWLRQIARVTVFDVHLEDCVAGISQMPNGSIDLVITSPPYNLGVRYGKYSDRQDRRSYLNWCRKWAAQVRRVLMPNGSFFLNVGATPSNPMQTYQIVLEWRDLFVLQNTIHWVKSIAIDSARQKGKQSDPQLNLLPQGEEDVQRQVRANPGVSATTYGHFKPISSRRFLNDCH